MTRPKDGYYLIYLRKSRADVEKERYGRFETLAVHEEQLTRFAQREGYPVAEVYRELVSGESVAGRAEFRKVLDRINDPECRGVIVHAIDRLGRGDPMEYGWILSALRFSRTLVITPGRSYDPTDPADLQSLKLQMFVANVEYDHIRERMHGGSVASAERGNYVGSRAPYGYDRAVVDRRHTLVPNADEAPVVRRMYEMAAAGSNKGVIARALNADGIKSKRGTIWTAQRVGQTLSNPIYKGMVRYGWRQTRVVARDGIEFTKRAVFAAPGEYVLSKGVHEPLVADNVWEAANRKALGGAPVRRRARVKNPLAGVIVCGKCGRALVRQDVRGASGKRYPRLHHAYYTECQVKSVSQAYVVESLCVALERVADDLESGVTPCGIDHAELESMERRIAAEEGRLDKLIELYNAEAITVAEFKERRAGSDEMVSTLRARLAELRSRDVDAGEVAFRTREAIRSLRDPSLTEEEQNAVLKAVVERVEYFELDRARVNRKIELRVRLRGLS